MPGSYRLSKNPSGDYRFVLKAANGEVVLTSEIYKSRSSAENGIRSVQKNSLLDARFERMEAKNGKFYFNLKAANHQIIGTSQMYVSAQSRDAGVDSVKKNGPSLTIKEE